MSLARSLIRDMGFASANWGEAFLGAESKAGIDRIKMKAGFAVAKLLNPDLRSLPTAEQTRGAVALVRENIDKEDRAEVSTPRRRILSVGDSLTTFAEKQMGLVRRAHGVWATLVGTYGWKKREYAQTVESARRAADYLGSLTTVVSGTTELDFDHIVAQLPGRDGVATTVTIRPDPTQQGTAGFDVVPPVPELVEQGVPLGAIEMAATVLREVKETAAGRRQSRLFADDAPAWLVIGDVHGAGMSPTYPSVEPVHFTETAHTTF